MSDFWTEVLDGGDSKSKEAEGPERVEATARKPRLRLPRVHLPALPRLPRMRLPSFARSPRIRPPGFSIDPRSRWPEFLSDLPGVAARRWPAMLLAFAVGLASTFWILAGAQLLYRAQATVSIARPALADGQAGEAADPNAIRSDDLALDAVLSDESLSGLIEHFDLYSESGDAQPAALVAYMRGNIEVKPLPRLAQSRGGDVAMAYGFSFASGDPNIASAVANALALRFQETSRQGAGDPSTNAARDPDGIAQAAGEGASPGAAELARRNDRDGGSHAATGATPLEVSILDPATPPTSPQRTRTVVAFAGLLASLLLAAGVACLLEVVDPALLSAAQLARCSEAPILGSLPRVA